VANLSITKRNRMSVGIEFLSSAIKRFREYKALGEKTFARLSNDEMLWQPNNASNSIAVIVQHLHGNMLSRWTNFLTEDGEKEWRKRDEEFEAQSLVKDDIVQLWNDGWSVSLRSLESLSDDDLLRTIRIRSQPLLVIDAINRQLAHYSYHVGQIVYLGRWIKDAGWQSLSIPKGGSAEFNKSMKR